MRGRKGAPVPEAEEPDPTGWLIHSVLAEILLLHTVQIKYMAMFCYTYLHGCKLFGTFSPSASPSFKFVSMIFQCTGGGILVPIFINAIPVVLAQDAYPIAIVSSFLLHQYVPILREVWHLSPVFKTAVIFLYEAMRAYVVVNLTKAAAAAIAPTDFAFPVFGPIFCGAVAGCGGAFLPLNKGLDPIKDAGLAQPMISAAIGATFYHLFVSTRLSAGIRDAPDKARVLVAIFFIAYNLSTAFPPPKPVPPASVASPSTNRKTQ